MKIAFLQEARSEFLDALSYYEAAKPGLGERFKDEVDRTVLWLADHPELCRLRAGGYRRMNLRIFPYYIPYITRGTILWILAVAHGSRKPEYWISRKGYVRWPSALRSSVPFGGFNVRCSMFDVESSRCPSVVAILHALSSILAWLSCALPFCFANARKDQDGRASHPTM